MYLLLCRYMHVRYSANLSAAALVLVLLSESECFGLPWLMVVALMVVALMVVALYLYARPWLEKVEVHFLWGHATSLKIHEMMRK